MLIDNPLDFSARPTILVVDDTPDNLTLMMAVADVYYALISRRVYKDGMPTKKP